MKTLFERMSEAARLPRDARAILDADRSENEQLAAKVQREAHRPPPFNRLDQ